MQMRKKDDGVKMCRNTDRNLFECKEGFLAATGRECVTIAFYSFTGCMIRG